MTPEETELARALVALPGWEWRHGIAWVADTDCPLCHGYGGFLWHEADGSENGESCPCSGRIDGTRTWTGAIPDLRDPTGATAGALLAMLPPAFQIEHDAGGCSIIVFTGAGTVTGRGTSLGIAAARALVRLGKVPS